MRDRDRSTESTVKVRVTSRSRLSLTELSLGCSQLGNLYRAISDDEAAATVERAWELGIRYFDTAPHYGLGLSERRLGAALAGRSRDEYVVSTKVGRRLERLSRPTAATTRASTSRRRSGECGISVATAFFAPSRRVSSGWGSTASTSSSFTTPTTTGPTPSSRPTRRSKSCALKASSRRSVRA